MKLFNFLGGEEEEAQEGRLLLPACQHDWKIFSKTYAPPRRDAKIDGMPQPVAEKALLGVTTYLWECKICSAVRKEEMLGSDEQQLSELFEKVDKFGMQYVTEGDKTYAVARWVPEVGGGQTPLR